jgi:hypothetical protein
LRILQSDRAYRCPYKHTYWATAATYSTSANGTVNETNHEAQHLHTSLIELAARVVGLTLEPIRDP